MPVSFYFHGEGPETYLIVPLGDCVMKWIDGDRDVYDVVVDAIPVNTHVLRLHL